jgi:hypothetical protein
VPAKSLKHKFQSAVADGADSTVVRPSDWNQDHDLWYGRRDVTAATDTLTNADHLSLVTYLNTCTVSLPAPASGNMPSGWSTRLRNIGGTTVTITINGTGGATINGAASFALGSGRTLELQSNNTAAYIGILTTSGSGYTSSATTPGSPSEGDFWYDTSTGILSVYVNDGTSLQWVQVSPVPAGTTSIPAFGPPQGRLTLQSATPVMTTNQVAKTTIIYTPYVGNLVPIFDGSNFVMTAMSADISVATTDTAKNPAAIGANKVNDWFIWNDAGTLRLTHGPDWTDLVTRSAGTSLAVVKGILVNSQAITNGPAAQRGTYVGTTKSNASSQLDWQLGGRGTLGLLNVWNCYNRVQISSLTSDTTGQVAFASATGWVNYDNNQNSRCSYVCGLAEDTFACQGYGSIWVAGSGQGQLGLSFDIDATTAIAVGSVRGACIITSLNGFSSGAVADRAAGLGAHFFQLLVNFNVAGCYSYGEYSNVPASGIMVTGRM